MLTENELSVYITDMGDYIAFENDVIGLTKNLNRAKTFEPNDILKPAHDHWERISLQEAKILERKQKLIKLNENQYK